MVFKFQCMVYEKWLIWAEQKITKHFEDNKINKTEIMKHVLKMQWIFLLPKYIKGILNVFFM